LKPLLVGESNPYQTNEEDAMRYALYPAPARCSGWRLCRVIMGLDERTYLRSFDRIDLCHPKWSLPMARQKAAELLAARTEGDVIVALGSKVANAFCVPYDPFTVRSGIHNGFGIFATTAYGPQIIVLPHPSGLNRAWHQSDAVARARAVLREAGVLRELWNATSPEVES
jgi:hypothetical protein